MYLGEIQIYALLPRSPPQNRTEKHAQKTGLQVPLSSWVLRYAEEIKKCTKNTMLAQAYWLLVYRN
jgi:hypothetical protein